MALTSPGVQVSVIDESFYTPAEPGTVPMIFVASASNKTNAAAIKMQGSIAKPSRPSVRFTALLDPVITKITHGIKNIPKYKPKSLKNGAVSIISISFEEV